jgi:Fe-S-cluster-containing hydrogenase component 2
MIKIRAELCPANHPCPSVHICPAGAISQVGNQAPVVDRELCTNCGMCLYSCPVFAEEPVASAG